MADFRELSADVPEATKSHCSLDTTAIGEREFSNLSPAVGVLLMI